MPSLCCWAATFAPRSYHWDLAKKWDNYYSENATCLSCVPWPACGGWLVPMAHSSVLQAEGGIAGL